jgi:hypothetical protein
VIKTLSLHDAHFTTTDCTNATIIFKKTTKPEKALHQSNNPATPIRRDQHNREYYYLYSEGYTNIRRDSAAPAGS